MPPCWVLDSQLGRVARSSKPGGHGRKGSKAKILLGFGGRYTGGEEGRGTLEGRF